MCGIFAYLNHGVPRDRKFLLSTLVSGLKRLEYRGYDSAGMAVDSDEKYAEDRKTAVIKRSGKVAELEKAIAESKMDDSCIFENHCGIAHTRWATHGPPNEINCHPHISDADNQFVVVHNGIITNCGTLRTYLESKVCW